MYYLKLENAEEVGDGMMVTANGMTFMVPREQVCTSTSPNNALLEHMRRLTSHIEGLSQPPNLSPQRVPAPSPTPTAAPDLEAREEPSPALPSQEELEELGLGGAVVNAPFQVNEQVTKPDIAELGRKLNSIYENHPKKRIVLNWN